MVATEETKISVIACKILVIFFSGTLMLRFIFTAVYFQQIGLSSTYTGILQGVPLVSQAIGGIIFGYIADRADLRKVVFLGSYLAYTVTPLLITIPQPVHHCHNTTNNNMTDLKVLSEEIQHPVTKLDKQDLPNLQDAHFYGEMKKRSTFPENETSRRLKGSKTFEYSLLLTKATSRAHTKSELQNKHTDGEWKLFVIELVIVTTGDFFAGAVLNLCDMLLVGAVDDKKQYGKIRLWGNIGQAVIIPLLAVITYYKTVDICGVSVSDFKYALYSASLISSVGLVFSIFKAHFPSSKVDADKKDTKGEAGLKELLVPLETWSLLVNSFFYGALSGAATSFLFWTMVELNISQANFSIAVANFFRNGAGLTTYLVAPKLLHLVGYRTTMIISCLIYACAFIVLAIMRSAWLGVLVEVFVGSAYAVSMAACVSYIGEVAHPSLAVTAQGLLHFTFTGVGLATGPAVAGVLLDYVGQTITFLIFAAVCIVLMVFSIIVQCILKVRHDDYQKLSKSKKKRRSN